MDNDDELRVYVVVLSHRQNSDALSPVLRWIVLGVKNEMAAMRAVMGSNTQAQADYNRLTCQRIESSRADSVVGIFPIPKGV